MAEPTAKARDFFISYNKADVKWAEWIAWKLEEAGYTTVIQVWDFRPGGNWALDMHRGLENSDRVLAVLSPHYLSAHYVHPEWAKAFAEDPEGLQGKLLPVRIAECKPGGLLGQIIYTDLCGKSEEEAEKILLAGAAKGRAKPKTAPPFPGHTKTPPPFPGRTPKVWNALRQQKNNNFTGREELLDELHRRLTAGAALALTAMHGMGGVGKTQAALEYSYRFAFEYQAVWWMRAEESASLALDFAALADALGLPEAKEQDKRLAIAAVIAWLEGHTGWLLVFDNAVKPEDVTPYLPCSAGGHVIVTSRNSNWRGTADTLEVELMPPEEAADFLLRRGGRDDREDAARVAEALGYLPLALEQAGAYVEAAGVSYASYLALYGQKGLELFNDARPSHYKDRVTTTWTISFERAKDESIAGMDLMNLLSFFAADNIPKDMIVGGAEYYPPDLAEEVRDPLRFNREIAALRKYSLIKSDDRTISVHRLVQEVLRDRMSKSEKKLWAEAAVNAADEAMPQEADDVRTWPVVETLQDHAMAAAQNAEKLGVGLKSAGRVFNQAAMYMQGRAMYSQARELYQHSLENIEKVLGCDNENFASILNNIGSVLYDMDDFKGARHHFERALAIDEDILGKENENVARDLNNLGDLLHSIGDLEGSRNYLERASRILEKALDKEHPRVASNLNNLAGVLQDMGEYESARDHYKRALVIDEKVFKKEHPNVARDLNNLGIIYFYLGDLKSARNYLIRALEIIRKFLPDDHPTTILYRKNLEIVESRLRGRWPCCGGVAFRALRDFLDRVGVVR